MAQVDDKPFMIRWTGGDTVDVIDSNQNVVATLNFDQLLGFKGMWASTDRGKEWVPVWAEKDTGAIFTGNVPVPVTITYTRNADNFITSEVWQLPGCTITVTYTRNAANFITQTAVVIS